MFLFEVDMPIATYQHNRKINHVLNSNAKSEKAVNGYKAFIQDIVEDTKEKILYGK